MCWFEDFSIRCTHFSILKNKICTFRNMKIMNLEADLKWIHQELDNVKDPAFIEAIKNMLKYRKKLSSGRISIGLYNEEIDRSIAQIERGEYFTHQELGERIKQWGNQ